jgi:hypothetical protein
MHHDRTIFCDHSIWWFYPYSIFQDGYLPISAKHPWRLSLENHRSMVDVPGIHQSYPPFNIRHPATMGNKWAIFGTWDHGSVKKNHSDLIQSEKKTINSHINPIEIPIFPSTINLGMGLLTVIAPISLHLERAFSGAPGRLTVGLLVA